MMRFPTWLTTALLAVVTALPHAVAKDQKVGAGTIALQPRGYDSPPPLAAGRTDALMKTAAATNQWYSTLLFDPTPEPIYAQPVTVRTVPGAFEFALPVKEIVPSERRDVEVHYTHRNPLVLSPVAFQPGAAKLAKVGDWSIDISMAAGADELRATVAHGSPYAQLRISRGDLRVQLPQAGARIDASTDPRTLALRVGAVAYGLYAPTGARWEQVSSTEWIARLPSGGAHVAVAALPDATAASVALLGKHAWAFIDDTRVSWHYDRASSAVHTTFTTKVRTIEGPEVGPLLGLYPHHWFENRDVAGRLGPAYDTIRGPIKLLAAGSFRTTKPFHGFVPWWPAVSAEGESGALLRDVMQKDVRDARMKMLEIGKGPYWQGKGLQRITKLMDVVEAQGDAAARDRLLGLVKARFETWFSGDTDKTYFHLDNRLGTVLGYPEEYFSVEQMNDHHFHYGYWIRAAAEIALRDPAWAAKDRWGGMVDLLVADIATPERGRADFPFLRNFDPYESHSWASGVGMGAHGNNQESSSEAVNAWAALVLWGEVNGDRALTDLGAYLFASETDAIQHYWFDIHKIVFAPEYRAKRIESSMVFGGKYAHNTWWTDEPRQIKGINLLPITTSSVHLARDPAFITASLATLDGEVANWLSRGKGYFRVPKDIWQDIFVKYHALAAPDAALKAWERWGSVEFGDTRTHTLHWALSLKEMGVPDLATTADTPLYSVFKRADGRRTYLAFNAGKVPVTVRFSDGKTLQVPPGRLAKSN